MFTHNPELELAFGTALLSLAILLQSTVRLAPYATYTKKRSAARSRGGEISGIFFGGFISIENASGWCSQLCILQ